MGDWSSDVCSSDLEDVGVVVDANHMCVASRGVSDTNSKTGTAYFSGKFKDENTKRDFLNYINTR